MWQSPASLQQSVRGGRRGVTDRSDGGAWRCGDAQFQTYTAKVYSLRVASRRLWDDNWHEAQPTAFPVLPHPTTDCVKMEAHIAALATPMSSWCEFQDGACPFPHPNFDI